LFKKLALVLLWLIKKTVIILTGLAFLFLIFAVPIYLGFLAAEIFGAIFGFFVSIGIIYLISKNSEKNES
jgi:uncharacterized integral membrane protein